MMEDKNPPVDLSRMVCGGFKVPVEMCVELADGVRMA